MIWSTIPNMKAKIKIRKYLNPTLIISILVFGLIVIAVTNNIKQKNGTLTCPNCNVILVSIDSLRPDHLSTFGYSRATDPNLEKWSRNAAVFETYIATSYLTPISEMSLHTSLYPSESGVVNFSTKLIGNKQTLAEILKSFGYKTTAICSSPEFLFFLGIAPTTNNATSTKIESPLRKSFSRGFDEYCKEFDGYKFSGAGPSKELFVSKWQDFSAPKYLRGLPMSTLGWLKENRKEKFFLWLPIGTAHWPYNDQKPFHFADEKYDGPLRETPLDWSIFSRIYENKILPQDKKGSSVSLNEDDLKFLIDRYDDGLFLVDSFLGELFGALKENGLDKNTIVVIASEHGESLGEHGYIAHYDVLDTDIKVPLIIKLPEVAGSRIRDQISSVDVLPTILDALEIPPPAQAEGASFLNSLTKKTSSSLSYAFIERIPLWENIIATTWRTYGNRQFTVEQGKAYDDFSQLDDKNHYRDIAVRTNKWKLIHRQSREVQERYSWWHILSGKEMKISEYELYDLENDPNETENVLDRYPEEAGLLKQKLAEWEENTQKRRPPIEQGPILQPYF